MVRLTTGKGKAAVDSIANELVGLEQPTPFITALYAYTVKKTKDDDKQKAKKANEETGPSNSIARAIKRMSVYPNIYNGLAEPKPKY